MRLTGEASRPVSGDFVCRLSAQAGPSLSALRHRLAEPEAPGLHAAQPSRVDSVARKLVVSGSHSKSFFRISQPCAFRRMAMQIVHSPNFPPARAEHARNTG